jgi:hypothetical protein
MKSEREADLLDLERDLPTTDEDVRALRRKPSGPACWEEYLRFLASLPPPRNEALRARRGPGTGLVFQL